VLTEDVVPRILFCLVVLNMFFECKRAIKGNSTIFWVLALFQLLSIPYDVEVTVSFSVLKVEREHLCLGWVSFE